MCFRHADHRTGRSTHTALNKISRLSTSDGLADSREAENGVSYARFGNTIMRQQWFRIAAPFKQAAPSRRVPLTRADGTQPEPDKAAEKSAILWDRCIRN